MYNHCIHRIVPLRATPGDACVIFEIKQDWRHVMSTEIMNIVAVIIGPISAVIITLIYQNLKEKRDIKHRAFLTLMAHRKSIPPNRTMVQYLNTLDVVFSKNQTIVDLWHKYFDLLSQPPRQEREHVWLELLSAIAKDLNYPKIKQTDLDKFYFPEPYWNQLEFSQKFQRELLRVLENTASLVVTKKETKIDNQQEAR